MLMRDNNDKIIVFKYIFEGPDNKQGIPTFGMCYSIEGGCHWSKPNFGLNISFSVYLFSNYLALKVPF